MEPTVAAESASPQVFKLALDVEEAASGVDVLRQKHDLVSNRRR